VTADFIDVNRVRYVDLLFDISAFGDRAALVGALDERLAAIDAESAGAICRLRLVGEAQSTLDVDVGATETELGQRYEGLVLVEDFATFDLDEVLREGRTVRAEFVREMRAKIDLADVAERPLLERALRFGMLAFSERTIPT
jgi:hypothetical protein